MARVFFACRWFDVSVTSKGDREVPSDGGPGMFTSNVASQEQTYHRDEAPTLGYRSSLGPSRAVR